MEQQLIKSLDEIRIGDEVIISANSYLKYLKILRLPTKQDGTRFKVSLSRNQMGSGQWTWYTNNFEMDPTKHNAIMYQDLSGRDVFLVKREFNN